MKVTDWNGIGIWHTKSWKTTTSIVIDCISALTEAGRWHLPVSLHSHTSHTWHPDHHLHVHRGTKSHYYALYPWNYPVSFSTEKEVSCSDVRQKTWFMAAPNDRPEKRASQHTALNFKGGVGFWSFQTGQCNANVLIKWVFINGGEQLWIKIYFKQRLSGLSESTSTSTSTSTNANTSTLVL